jgi:hypothetical protein
MSQQLRRSLAAGAYLAAFALSFLPGAALCHWAKERDPWLEAHGRSAAWVNVAIFVGWILLAPFTHTGDLLAVVAYLYRVAFANSAVPNRFPSGTLTATVPHGVCYAIWGPHYFIGLLMAATTLLFLLLWCGSLLFNLSSAWHAWRGFGPWLVEGGGRKAAGHGCGDTAARGSREGRRTRAEETVAGQGERGPGSAGGVGPPTRGTNDTAIWRPGELAERAPPGADQARAATHPKPFPALAALAVYLAAAVIELLLSIRCDVRHMLIASSIVTDPSIFLWSLVWWPWAIGHGVNPFLTHSVWAPVGKNVLWMTSVPSLALLLAPVTHFFGPIVSYNLIALLAPVLAAWATYLLCRHITGKFWPAVFGGWVFGFSSDEFSELRSHMHLFVTVALPLAVWIYLLRRGGKLSRWWYVGLIALLAIFQFGVSTEILASAVPLGLLAALLAGFLPRREHSEKGKLAFHSLFTDHWVLFFETLTGLIIAGVALLPCFADLYFVQRWHGIAWAGRVAIPLQSLLLPPPTTWLAGRLVPPIPAPRIGGVDDQAGYFGLPLLVVAWLFVRQCGRDPRDFFVFLLLVGAAVLSFGVSPQLAPFANTAVPVALPWTAVGKLPLYDMVLPARLIVYAWLAIAVVAARWLAESRMAQAWKLLLAALTVVSLLPNIPGGYWRYAPLNPRFFTDGLAARYLPRGARVVVLPYGYAGYSMLWQAETRFYFSMAGGYVAPNPSPISNHYPAAYCPTLEAFYAGRANGPDYPARLRRFIKAFKIRAFIVVAARPRRFRSLVAPLHIKPIHVGGVWLYLLRGKRP